MKHRRIIGYGCDGLCEHADKFAGIIHPEDSPRVMFIVAGAMERGHGFRVTYRTAPDLGPPAWLATAGSPRQWQGRTVWETVTRDITEDSDVCAPLPEARWRDPLTGLVTRALFPGMLADLLHSSRSSMGRVTLHLIDLDDFKDVNHALGCEAGDVIIRILAHRLAALVGDRGLVARLGDDEYAVAILDPCTVTSQNEGKNGHWAEAIAREVSRPIAKSVGTWIVSASQGISSFSAEGADTGTIADSDIAQQMIMNAQTALQYVKRERRREYAVYDDHMLTDIRQRLIVRQAMENALGNAEFELYFQPKVELETGRITGAEALLRWFSPEIGHPSPTYFIPIAEASGMIVPIGRWILEEACRCRSRLDSFLDDDGVIAVNVSGVQIRDPDFADMVARTLERTGVKPSHLELELTEGLLILASDAAKVTLKRLRAMGVRIMIDDFGSGYASFAYLKDFTVDGLKIDKRYIQHMTTHKIDAAIVRALISISQSLDLKVVAEGVETKQQRRQLLAEGCLLGQGFLFSQPLPQDQFLALLQNEPVS